MSKQKKKKDDKVRSIKRGESIARQSKDGQFLATVWRDKKHVYNLNSYYDPLYNRRECTVVRKERNKEIKRVNGVKHCFRAESPLLNLTNTWVESINMIIFEAIILFRELAHAGGYISLGLPLTLALINAFVIYKHQHPKVKHEKFHLKVIINAL